ncbi:AMP-binding enzyme [Palleronia pelagia]|uniref:AMP-binding enzyme C-terminal domain-containing protein n=1 Tax=Palleronia pelagia TaxID=387096 RepID=A0A1H8JL35_9RHOB|nr:hypothetical protein [Palleronia pelagia]SEN81046.1 AMP-binding enzyme C-terminal domain-containing protein [Palleronia pelagia]
MHLSDGGTISYAAFVGRAKGLIISGGYNVYPNELEDLLDLQPGVLESAVVGAPHPDFGDTPVAFLVPEGDGPDMASIEATVRDRLARYKHPRATPSSTPCRATPRARFIKRRCGVAPPRAEPETIGHEARHRFLARGRTPMISVRLKFVLS